MNKFVKLIAGMSVCAVCLSGCGSAKLPEVVETTTLSIDKEGGIVSYLVADFTKDYYDVSELAGMALEDVAAYNEEHQEGGEIPVSVVKVEMLADNERVVVQHKFHDADAYEAYTEGVLFFGTVVDAVAEGYDVSASLLSSVKDGSLVSDDWIAKEAADKHIIITDNNAEVYCPYKVTHISSNAVYNENGSVDAAQTKELVFILMNK